MNEDIKRNVDLRFVKPEEIEQNEWNPNSMEQHKFDALVNSIKDRGFKQPLLVREAKSEDGTPLYQIIDGEHRWKAAIEAKVSEIPVVVVESDEIESKLDTIAMNNLRGEMMSVGLAELIVEIKNEKGLEYLKKYSGFMESQLVDYEKLLIPPDLNADYSSDVKKDGDAEVPVDVSILLFKDSKAKFDQCLERAMSIAKKTDTIALIDCEDKSQVEKYDKAMQGALRKLNSKRRSEALEYICDIFLARTEDEEE